MFNSSRFIVCCTVLLWTFPGIKQDVAIALGDRFFNSENYYDAITEYKRYIFFNSEKADNSTSYAYYKIGLCYFHQKKQDTAISELRKSVQTANTDKMRDERKIDLAVVLIASGMYSSAEFVLIKVEMYSPFPELKRKAAYLRGIASLYSFKWDQANEAFHVYFNELEDESQGMPKQLESLLNSAQNIKYKSLKLAKVLSTILPGSGQIYAGDWRNGINALLLNFVTGYFFVDDILQRQFQDAFFQYLFLFGRFYRGNRYHAKESAKKYNEKLNQNLTSQIFKELQRELDNEKNKNN